MARREDKHLYNSARWQKRRAAQLSSFPLCKMCLEEGKTRAATIADHRIPHRGDEVLFHEGVLDSLCKPHHDSVKQGMERGRKRKGFNELGEPLDPSHPWYDAPP